MYTLTLSSHSNGRCKIISSGSESAAMTMNSEMPRLSVFVAKMAKKQLITAGNRINTKNNR